MDASPDGAEESRAQLVKEMCLVPEVYFALSEILSGKNTAPVPVEKGNIADVDDSNFDECIFASSNQNEKPDASDESTRSNDNPLDLASDVVDYFERMSKLREEQQAAGK
jgi:hypothetical protein